MDLSRPTIPVDADHAANLASTAQRIGNFHGPPHTDGPGSFPFARDYPVEPVCRNIRHNKGLPRLNLRGREKVNAPRHLCGMVHNIEKLAHRGWRG